MEYVKNPQVVYHRNGVCGEGFNVVAFEGMGDNKGMDFIAITFSNPEIDPDLPKRTGFTAVLRLNDLIHLLIDPRTPLKEIDAWRGDVFEPEVLQAIRDNWNKDSLR
mgnify:CR=1 FL=1